MGRETICLLVLGLANILTAAEIGLDNVSPSEVKEIEAEIAKGNVPPDFLPGEKSKRGVTKLSNADSPSFNHLSTTATSSLKTSFGQPPYRYVYNSQFYPTSQPYLPYLQSPHAAQIAAQYSFQPSVAPYISTPTQFQYVSTPGRYQTINTKVGGGASSVSAAAATAAQYVTPTPQIYLPMHQVYQTQSQTAHAAPAAAAAQYSTPQQYYLPQQPIVMLLVSPQPQPTAMIYPAGQQHQVAYILGQQNPLMNLYSGHRFSLPYTPASNQVTYLVPMAVQTSTAQQSAAGVKTVDKTTSAASATSAAASTATSYGVRTNKA